MTEASSIKTASLLLLCLFLGSIALCLGACAPAPILTDKELYDPARLLEIEITMPPEDWDFVRNQKRKNVVGNLFGPQCLSAPWDDPYQYRPATVAINGQIFQQVGVSKKGFIGSVNPIKPSLKLKFDKFVKGQTMAGLERLTLNNNTQDNALISQCLAYGLFRKAGLPAPRCNLATVKVNGQYLGVYSNVESINKQFLAQHFASDKGNLYEGTFSDFRDLWMATWEAKTSDTQQDLSVIKAVKEALAASDENVIKAVSLLVDLDRFYTYWALEGLLNHTDGYTNSSNNFYIYNEPTDPRLVFMPWGMDSTFSFSFGKQAAAGSDGVFVRSALAHRLYQIPEGKSRLFAAMKKLLRDVWNETELTATMGRLKSLIGDKAAHDPFLKEDSLQGAKGDGDFASAFEEVRSFVQGRRGIIQRVIDASKAMQPVIPPLQSRLCEKKD